MQNVNEELGKNLIYYTLRLFSWATTAVARVSNSHDGSGGSE